ncbi:MAG TPA: 30S ribosomal protein S7 [Candidatus Bathyarchaeia archaeon]|nr:30S ribosomal protein S7 [Candidatus Bathyarchaeia archaeon]
MARSGKVVKRLISPDPLYNNRLVTKLINQVMRQGKKNIAQKIVYRAFDRIEEETGQKPLEVFRQAVENIKPGMEVKPRRIGGAAYQIPLPVRGDRKESLAIRWLIQAAKAKPNKEYHRFDLKLAAEIIAAARGEGGAVKRREDIQRLAESNKAFAHFRW